MEMSNQTSSRGRIPLVMLFALMVMSILLLPVVLFGRPAFPVAQAKAAGTPSVRVMYHFYRDAEENLVDHTSYQDYRSSCFYTPQVIQDDSVLIQANHFPSQIPVSTDPAKFDVILDYASVQTADHPGPVEITDEAAYDETTGQVVLPAEFAERDITVAFYVPEAVAQTSIPVTVNVRENGKGDAGTTALTMPVSADSCTVDVSLFPEGSPEADDADISVMQNGLELSQWTMARGSVSIVATPLGGPIDIYLPAMEPDASNQPDAIHLNSHHVATLSTGLPVVGSRYIVPADTPERRSTLIMNNGDDVNTALLTGWEDKFHKYGFFVHFHGEVNPDYVDADMNHIASGGFVETTNGGRYDFRYIAGWHFAWGECKGDVRNNGAGMPLVTSGFIEVVNVDPVSRTVTYRYELETCSDMPDHHKMQTICGNFQLPGVFEGTIDLQKTSANPSISEGNSCYSLAGAQYGIFSDSACEASVATLTTNEIGYAQSGPLTIGDYYVKELQAPPGFQLDPTVYPVTVLADQTTRVNGSTVSDVPRFGSAEFLVKKVDSGTGNPAPQGNASLEGSEFTATHYPGWFDSPETAQESGEPLYTWIMATDKDGSVAFDEDHRIGGDPLISTDESDAPLLPLGTLLIKETAAPTGYLVDDQVYLHIIGDPTNTRSLEIFNHPTVSEVVIRGDIKFQKKDDDTSLRMAGIPFRITSKTTGESHIAVTDANGSFDSSSDAIPHTLNTNANDAVADENYQQNAGFWFGDEAGAAPDDRVGALPYDCYDIEELPCTANEGKQLVRENDVQINSPNYVVDFGTIDNQSCSLSTTATDGADGDKILSLSEETVIVDRVGYVRLTPGVTYEITGELVYTETGEPVLVDDVPVTVSSLFTPEYSNGMVDMEFRFDGSELPPGASLTVFETVTLDGRLVAEHRDLTSAEQTVTVDAPLPTGQVWAKTGVDMRSLTCLTLLLGFLGFAAVIIGLYRYHNQRRESQKEHFPLGPEDHR